MTRQSRRGPAFQTTRRSFGTLPLSEPYPYVAAPINSPITNKTPGIVNAKTVPAIELRQAIVNHGARNSPQSTGISESRLFLRRGAGSRRTRTRSATTHKVSSMTASTPSFMARRRSRRAGNVNSRLSVRPVYSCPIERAPRLLCRPSKRDRDAPKRRGAFVDGSHHHAREACEPGRCERSDFLEIDGGSMAMTLMRWPCPARASRRRSLRASATRLSAFPETALSGATSRRPHCH